MKWVAWPALRQRPATGEDVFGHHAHAPAYFHGMREA